MDMDVIEQYEHYDFYVDNCEKDEIPISFECWKENYLKDLIYLIEVK